MVKVWDSFVRGYHWLLVIGVVSLWWTAEYGFMEWHFRTAFVVGALLVSRLVWAVFGSSNARFSAFVKSPKAVVRHVQELRSRSYQPGATHNAAGGWAVLALWLVLAIQLSTGLFATDDIFYSGPLASLIDSDLQGLITDVHEINFNVLLALIAVHILAILVYQLRGVNLVKAMIHGKRNVQHQPNVSAAWWAWLLAAVIAASAWYFWG